MTGKYQDIISLLSEESFQRYLSGKASEKEIKSWKKWLNESPSNRVFYDEALLLWQKAQFRTASQPDVDVELERLQQRLKLKSKPTPATYDLSTRSVLKRRQRQVHESWLRFGAVAIAALVLFSIIWRFTFLHKQTNKTEYQVVSTEFGQRTKITLPEGTTIVLNAHSSLRYPALWTRSTARKFELQGEAYFDIASVPHGQQHDFVVQTIDGTVQVVGTRFVVYERGQGTRVVVEEGDVEVTATDTSALKTFPSAKALLRPGNLLRFKKGMRTLKPKSVNILPYTTWWLDKIILEETPFEQIVQRLEETYDVQVKVVDKRLLKRTLSGSIENQSLGIITEALAKALRVSVHRQGKQIIFGSSKL